MGKTGSSTLKFDGKIFKEVRWFTQQAGADDLAGVLRKQGKLVRVVHTNRTKSRNYWGVFAREG